MGGVTLDSRHSYTSLYKTNEHLTIYRTLDWGPQITKHCTVVTTTKPFHAHQPPRHVVSYHIISLHFDIMTVPGSIYYNTHLQPRLATMHSCLVGIDDIHKRRLQAGTANKEAIDISLLGQLVAVLLRHAAAVEDTGLLRSLGRNLLVEPLAERLMDFLGLLGGCDLAGANGPVVSLACGQSIVS